MDLSLANTTVLPGDIVGKCDRDTVLSLGPGLQQREDGDVVAIKPGLLKHDRSKYWIDTPEKRYVPMLGDMVIGIITGKMGESFKVDIGAYLPAQLSFYAFEGATKKNKPDLKVSYNTIVLDTYLYYSRFVADC
ncbi:Exosome complex component rrp40 [Oopsacas minuta]|uniref:Exosome complex component rrp40 n=1 Tax=Oopsacas minuta TaxID=111878 RepID=A0AAV7K751_9METZ|nr:Exosome complex component rrp40 [Oopsacas minuta]